eukprot:Plantae.Rhodophyta-Purpureofilum_apyrenoidigerum.ctg62116.p1 GENE.Plantae.Rhodophyta-Purpureofilum_apyrenoidigerum.ctg62116~~Plantae.Rhodophyta-Purpureofilum_apyrenoidigerum.ctg62116.p1  ORF type:complete len:244 (+),score=27.28 Plantae.Rhodophyta-Purpureofilum_apyrenoidigerum.ctg62116:287-1018(+)
MQRIVFENEDFVVIDKPHGVPTQPLIDNRIECVPYQLHRAMNDRCECRITSRLDVSTSGLLVLAKNAQVSAAFNRLHRQRQIRKMYTVVCRGKAQPGEVKHMCRSKGHPKRKGRDYLLRRWSDSGCPDGWTDMHMVIREVQQVDDNVCECQVELITGRTHQIRLQMAALGSPVLGDTRYDVVSNVLEEDLSEGQSIELGQDPLTIALRACRLEFEWKGAPLVITAGAESWQTELTAAQSLRLE